MRFATYREFLDNVYLYVGLYRTPAHWEYDEEDKETPYKFVSDRDNNLLLPPHAKTLKEFFNLHLIRIDDEERSLIYG